ncbi:hypothetical protein J2Z21_009441 [Streptomyces griseochromogenes]|uniref:Uncharacterized protein n=1 Tax=Streptomyces griseochromogenes TaxID=68214 RepID=A0ABS4M9S9_9ACTN|nr:hypothetical protein [Streptomyces griseochromogenes]
MQSCRDLLRSHNFPGRAPAPFRRRIALQELPREIAQETFILFVIGRLFTIAVYAISGRFRLRLGD